MNGLKKQAQVAALIIKKVDFKPKLIKRDKEGHYTFIKGKIHQNCISVPNIYAPNTRVPNCVKEKILQLKSQID